MASTNKTSYLELNQWVGSDPVLRSDFNLDNQKLDTAFQALPKLSSGSYTGTGTTGSSNPRSLTLSFTPKLFGISCADGSDSVFGVVANGATVSLSGFGQNYLRVTVNGTAIQWVSGSNDSNAANRFNTSGKTYYYCAIG